MNDIPRRIRIDLQTPIEAAIRAARDAVEGGPAHPHMTRATVLLGQALDAVADFVDGAPIHPAPADDASGAEAKGLAPKGNGPFSLSIVPADEIPVGGTFWDGERWSVRLEGPNESHAFDAAPIVDDAGGQGDRYECFLDVALVPAPLPARDDAVVEALPTRGDVGRREATRDPVFLLQVRDKGRRPEADRWRTDGVWFTREEAEAFAAAHVHRWPDDRYGKRWHVYCVPADGDLARLLKAVTKRDAALRGKGGA